MQLLEWVGVIEASKDESVLWRCVFNTLLRVGKRDTSGLGKEEQEEVGRAIG